MTIQDVMTPHVETIGPDASIKECAQKMKSLDVGVMPVAEGGQIIGMLTDRDMAIRATAEGRGPGTKVREVMTRDVEYCLLDQDIEEAARLMQEKQIRRVVVMDHDRNLAGILSLGDLAVDVGGKVSEETLERVSEPSKPRRAA